MSQTIFYSTNKLRESGASEAEVLAVRAALRRGFAIARAGGRAQEFNAVVEPLQKYPAFVSIAFVEFVDDTFVQVSRSFPEWSIRADEIIAEARLPTLALFGEDDAVVDWRESAEVYRAEFARGMKRDLTIKSFKGADHGLQPTHPRYRDDDSMFVKGYAETMIDWLQRRDFTSRKR